MLGAGPQPCDDPQGAASNNFILQFTRDASGNVAGFTIQGFGIDPKANWVKA